MHGRKWPASRHVGLEEQRAEVQAQLLLTCRVLSLLPCRAGLNLYQINSQTVGGNYTGSLLLAVSKRSLLEGRKASPAYAAFSGWDADSTFSLVPAVTQVSRHLCILPYI